MASYLPIEELTGKVWLALREEGCPDVRNFEVVRLQRVIEGQRNWDIGLRGPQPAPPHIRRRMINVQIQLGQRYQLQTND